MKVLSQRGDQLICVTDGRAEEAITKEFTTTDLTAQDKPVLATDLPEAEIMVVDPSFSEFGLDTFAAAQDPSKPFVLIEDAYATANRFLTLLSSKNLPLPDRICVLDEAAKRIIVHAFPQLENNIVVTGQPAFDQFAHEDTKSIAAAASLNLILNLKGYMICLWYMTKHKHIIQLSKKDRAQLQTIIRSGKHNARVSTRARILMFTNQGVGKDAIARVLGIGRSTVQRTRDHYRTGGLTRALYDAPRSGQPLKLNAKAEAHLVARACSAPPDGCDHWTLELLRKQLIKDGVVKSISTVTLWKRLTNRGIKPWLEKNVVYSHHHTGVH